MMTRWCIYLSLVAMMLAGLVRGIAENIMLNQCSELKAQEHLDLQEVMGKWYVVEVVEHRNERQPASTAGTLGTSRIQIDVCPIVKLHSAEGRSGSRSGPPRISLLWEEGAGTLEYNFWVPGTSSSLGVWNSDIIQNGTLADKPTYRQFVGTVHVMKAVAAHLVLTFCARDIDGQKFTILLGREHQLPKADLRSVHNLLARRGLQLLSFRESCANGSAGTSRAWLSLIGLGLLLIRMDVI